MNALLPVAYCDGCAVAKGQNNGKYIPMEFEGGTFDFLWSSTEATDESGHYWSVYDSGADINSELNRESHHVLCVRCP